VWLIRWGCGCIFGSGSSVGIAIELRAGRSRIESRLGRDFPPVQTGPGAHLASCKLGTGSFPGVKCGRGVLLITHSLLVPRSWKSRAIPLYPPSGPHRASNGITISFIFVAACIRSVMNDSVSNTEIIRFSERNESYRNWLDLHLNGEKSSFFVVFCFLSGTTFKRLRACVLLIMRLLCSNQLHKFALRNTRVFTNMTYALR